MSFHGKKMLSDFDKSFVRSVISRTRGESLNKRIKIALPEIRERLLTISKSIICRFFELPLICPPNAQAARSLIERTDDRKINKIKQLIHSNGGFISLRELSDQTDPWICKKSVCNIIEAHLNLQAFKFIKSQHLLVSDPEKRAALANTIIDYLNEDINWY